MALTALLGLRPVPILSGSIYVPHSSAFDASESFLPNAEDEKEDSA